MALISRDPFARMELHRAREPTSATCAWCGNILRTKTGRTYLFRYRYEYDGGRRDESGRLFCSVGCMRSFYDVEN